MAGWKLNDIASGLQGAVLDASAWRGLLAKLSTEVEGAGVVLISTDTRYPRPLCSPDIDALVHTYGHDGWHERDLRYRGVPIMERRGIITDFDCIDPDDMRTSDYYETFLASLGRRWFAGVGFRAGKDLWTLSIQRSVVSGPFAPSELRRLLHLWRPFTDAATLSKLFGDMRILATVDALELVSHAAIVCDDKGCVVRMNRAAERLVGDGAGLGRRIGFRHAPSAALFDALLDSACANALAPVATPRAIEVLNNQKERLVIRAVCLEDDVRCLFARSSILLLLKPKPPSVEEHLRDMFGLTAAEVAVAAALFHGSAPRDIAAERSIRIDTVRAQLKAVFSKTDTSSQAQLVALMSRLVAVPP